MTRGRRKHLAVSYEAKADKHSPEPSNFKLPESLWILMHPRHLLHLPRCTLKGTPHGCIAKAKHCQPALRPKDLEWGRLKIKYDNNWQQHDWPYWAWIAARSVVQQCEVVHQFQLHWYCKIQLSTVQHWPCFPLPAYFPSQRLLQPQRFPAPLRAAQPGKCYGPTQLLGMEGCVRSPPSWGPKWLCLVVTQGLWWKKQVWPYKTCLAWCC